MSTIHNLLDETQKQCQALVEEMKAFKSAKALNQKAAEGLDATCKALNETAKAIEPFTEIRVKKLAIALIGITALNFIMFLAILLTLYFRTI